MEYVNKNLLIEIGSVFIHKASKNQVVVIDFSVSSNPAPGELGKKDKRLPICSYQNPVTGSYESRKFVYEELEPLEEEYDGMDE